MEKIEGESLAALRKRGATLSENEVAAPAARRVARCSTTCTGASPPVIHRDLKPGNVIRRPDGSFAFVDFGAVRDKLRPEGGSTVVGTFGYMAPEQFQGRALPASDVYAVGATALADAHRAASRRTCPHKGLAIDVRAALRERRGAASERLVGMLEAMLEPDPDRRASRIAPLLGALTGDAARTGRPPRTRRPARKRLGRFASRQARRSRAAGRAGGPPGPRRDAARRSPSRCCSAWSSASGCSRYRSPRSWSFPSC